MNRNVFFSLFIILTTALAFSFEVQAASGVTADVSSLDFGDQAQGTISAPQTVTLTNSLSGDGVIGSITLAGKDPRQFLITEDFCSGAVLGNLGSCSLNVVYQPSVEFPDGVGPAQADLQVTFQNPPALSIALSGNSLVPNIESNVSSLNFGNKVAGQQSDPQTVIITNSGEADLVLQGAMVIGGDSADFGPSLDQCSFQVLAPGESCTIELKMRATQLDERSAQFSIESNDPDEPLLLIDLSGKGTGSGGCALTLWGPNNSGLGVWFFFLIFPLIRLWALKK
jgi:HYDIN/CFA65/VesB family protein